MSVRDHHKAPRKVRHKMPEYARKAGPHQPVRTERKSNRADALRRAITEYLA